MKHKSQHRNADFFMSMPLLTSEGFCFWSFPSELGSHTSYIFRSW